LAIRSACAFTSATRPVTNEAAKRECGACHMAYQPQLLPAEAWQRVFAELGEHFGTDASLDEPVQKEILDYYVAHAGRFAAAFPPSPRITEAPWWMRAHRELRAAEWAKPEVKFKGNCTACHRRAEQALYEEE
jgi:mono/diheme cytochrome c family protein